MNSGKSNKTQDIKADLVIIGGGGAGLSAAISAIENGLDNIIILEKLNVPGGNTKMSSGMFASESPAQRRQAIDARNDTFFKILTDFSHWKVNPRLVRAFIDKSGDTIRWLEKKGLFFICYPMYPNQIATWHQASNNRGAEMVKVMIEECQRLGVKILTSTPAKQIIIGENGEVTGVLVENEDKAFIINTKNVIIASGGFGGNKKLLKKYCPGYRDNMLCDGMLHTGDGLLMAMESGAATEGLGVMLMSGPQIPNSVCLYLGNEPDTFIAPLMALALEPNTLWINKSGERFTDEALGFNHYVSSNTVNRQPENLSYTLLDQQLVQTMTEKGLIIGLTGTRIKQRTSMPELTRELQRQAVGYMSVQQSNRDICNGCGICVNVCSVNAISLDTLVEDIGESSPCRFTCPAGVDMRRYLYLLKQGNMDEAYQMLRTFLPLPTVTGRVCPHFCEDECARKEVDEPVNINSLERYVADWGQNVKAKLVPRKYSDKIAVIGSGPAGLSCAYFLTQMGYPVTVFEAMPALGGMLRSGIPEYRLPKNVLDEQIEYVRDMGVEFRTNVSVGKDITFDKLGADYKAIFYAIGNQMSRKIELEGDGLAGVEWGLDFLREANLNHDIHVKDNVVVIGGGNVAVDAALTCLRLGAKEVNLVCLEIGDEIPAFKEEINQALQEGVIVHEGWGPQRILGKGKVTSIELVRCESVFDAEGKFNPCYDKKTTQNLKTDMVILAIGQVPDHSLTHKDIIINTDGTVQTDSITMETSMPGVFAGGDIVSGTVSVVHAIGNGRNAAISVDRYLRGQDMRNGRDTPPKKVQNPPGQGIPKIARIQTKIRPVSEIVGTFDEIKTGFDQSAAEQEVQRCMTCGSRSIITYVEECRQCRTCEASCPVQAISPAPIRRIEPYVKIADSLDEIAEWMGADPKILKATVEEYNTDCDKGRDHIFAKDPTYLMPLRTPPYYAIKANSDFLDTIGGIKINENMQVLDKQAKPISGLYAVGVVAGGWQYDTYCVILAGAASGFAIISGRIAGEVIAGKARQ